MRGTGWNKSLNSDYHYGVPGYGYITNCRGNFAKVLWVGHKRDIFHDPPNYRFSDGALAILNKAGMFNSIQKMLFPQLYYIIDSN